MPRIEHCYTIAKSLLEREPVPDLGALHAALDPPIQRSVFYSITKWMQYHGAFESSPAGLRAELRRLLDLLAGVRRANLVPLRTSTTNLDVKRVHAALSHAKIQHTFGFMTAANLGTFYEPLERIQIYVPPGKSRQAAKALRNGRITVEWFPQRMDRLPTTKNADGLPITELLRTAIDTRAHPQAGAYAMILQNAIQRGI